MSAKEKNRSLGLLLGIAMIICAIVVSVGAIYLTEDVVSKISNTNFPNLK